MPLTDAGWHDLIAALQASGCKAALAITGGGTGAIGALLRVPGGSRLLIEAQVPYDNGALAAYLGHAPRQACSVETALALAEAAKARAVTFAATGSTVIGLGATAALVSDRPRKGEHRFHIAASKAEGVNHCTIVLAKGRRDRGGEEDLVARAIILWLARASGADVPSPKALLDADEHFSDVVSTMPDIIAQLVSGTLDRVTVQMDGQIMLAAPCPPVLLPGSFNPVHEGHLELAKIAREISGHPVAFEISVTNVDKPPLSADTIKQRLTQFAGQAQVELTRAPTFVEKARLLPGTLFVIGADTAERLFQVKYYGGDEAQMQRALDGIAGADCRFLVAVRLDATGRLSTLRDIAVPPRYAQLFTEIPESRFRLDTSSSAIRARATAQAR